MSQIDSALVMFSRLDECLHVQTIKVVQIALKQAEINELVELRTALETIISNQDRMIINSDSIDLVQRRIIRSKDKEIKRQKRQKIIIGIVGVVLIILI